VRKINSNNGFWCVAKVVSHSVLHTIFLTRLRNQQHGVNMKQKDAEELLVTTARRIPPATAGHSV